MGGGETWGAGSPAAWPGATEPPPAPRRRRTALVVGGLVGAVVVVLAVVVAVVVLSGGEDGDREALCRVLAGPPAEATGHTVWMEPDASEEEVAAVGDHLAAVDGVEGLHHVSQAEAFEEAMELFEDQPFTRVTLRPSDVPSSWRFTRRGPMPDLRDLDGIRDLSSSPAGTRLVDVLGRFPDDYDVTNLVRIDAAGAAALRDAAVDPGRDAADEVADWVEGDGATLGAEPSAAVRAAAQEVLASADRECGLRPTRPR